MERQEREVLITNEEDEIDLTNESDGCSVIDLTEISDTNSEIANLGDETLAHDETTVQQRTAEVARWIAHMEESIRNEVEQMLEDINRYGSDLATHTLDWQEAIIQYVRTRGPIEYMQANEEFRRAQGGADEWRPST